MHTVHVYSACGELLMLVYYTMQESCETMAWFKDA
jgi:hypothetical protein